MPNPLEWSVAMEGLFWTEVGSVVFNDPRTDWSEGLSLGYPFNVIREQVLAKGLADFSQGHSHPKYGPLSPDEKALLYSFVNFKKHFFACMATFQKYRSTIESLFASEGGLVLIDIGCGPGTACLALADLFPGRDLGYIGVDSAAPMRDKARALWEGAKTRDLTGKGSSATFLESWTELVVDHVKPTSSVLFVLSYCCASHTLTLNALKSLAHTVNGFRESRAGKPLVLAYMNSPNQLANRNYEVFKQELGIAPDQHPLTPLAIEFRKKRGVEAVSRDEFVYEVLGLKRS